jgi:uncharacterized protein YjbI with pentapeptide repeats
MENDGQMPADKNACLELLKSDPTAFFMAAKNVHFRAMVDLSHLDFSGLDLSDAPVSRRWDLTGSNLSGCRVNVAHLGICRLNQTNLSGIQSDASTEPLEQIVALWSGAESWNAWRKTHTPGALIGAELGGLDARGYDLTDVALTRSLMEGADFRGATLVGTGLAMASLGGARFDGMALKRVDFTNATLVQANFEGATLSLCRLDKADLTNANAQDTTFDRCVGKSLTAPGSNFSRSSHVKTVMTSAVLPESRWDGAKLESVFLEQSDLSGASFVGADVAGADFRGAQGLNLEGAHHAESAKV